MNKKSQVLNIREIKIKCSICEKSFITKIFPNKIYKGGNCFRPIGSKSAEEESWECDSCWDKPIVESYRPLD